VDRAHRFADRLVNAGNRGLTILGPSATALLETIASCHHEVLEPGQHEIVVSTGNHAANITPWVRLAERRGLALRWWDVDAETGRLDLDALDGLLEPGRTALVTFPHVSNLLGAVEDIVAITEKVHEAGARVVVDGVAFAPHQPMDVTAWNVDWYVWSCYKVYGPHLAALFGTHEAIDGIGRPNHEFIPRDDVPYQFQLGGVSHEAAAGLLGLAPYLALIAGRPGAADGESDAVVERDLVVAAFERMARLEAPLTARVLGDLRTRPGVARVIGPDEAGPDRVGTISFLPDPDRGIGVREIVAAAHRHGVGIRHGHMYSKRLLEAMSIDPDPGVVRISLVHFNDEEDIDRLLAAFDDVLPRS